MWSNEEARDWSIEINGTRHEHIPSCIMEYLVECAMIVAQTFMTQDVHTNMIEDGVETEAGCA